jgi:hypothetical protein
MTLAVQKNPGDGSGFFSTVGRLWAACCVTRGQKNPKNGAYILHCGIGLQKMKYWSER